MSAALPFLLWGQMVRIGWEAQTVIALRSAAMMGFLPQAPGEMVRMVTEKQQAAGESLHAAMRAAARGQRADQVLQAALRPYGRRTRANARRLTKKALS